MKKQICLITTVIAFLAMTAVAFAANTGEISVTSEPIRYHAECDKAGGIAIAFDPGTVFISGDQITADLPLNVSLCRNIDFVAGLAPGAEDATPYTSAWAMPAIGDTENGPVTGDGGAAALDSTGNGIAFWVHGTIGSQRVTIDIVSDANGSGNLCNEPTLNQSLEYLGTGDVSDRLVLSILDQAVYAGTTGGSNLYTDRSVSVAPCSTTTAYDNAVVRSENTLCINVSQYDGEYVKLSFDSENDKYTWQPSDPQVAHVVSALNIDFSPCAKNECGYLELPTPGEQSEGICYPINNEAGFGTGVGSYAGVADGYCVGTHRNNRVIIQETTGRAFDAGQYQIQLEILVDGVTGDRGAYFAGPIGYLSGATKAEVCGANASSMTPSAIYYNALNESNVYQIDASGTNEALAPAPADTDCSVASANRITKVKTAEVSLFDGVDDSFIWVDLPLIIRDATLFTEGQSLSVKVTILKAPCGELFSGTWCVGEELGCPTVDDPDACYEYSRVFPYFGAAGAFKNYMVLTNTTASDVTYTVEVYEQDGDMFTGTVTVGANSVEVNDLHSLTVAGGPGSFGDAKAYAIVKAPAMFYGNAFMINATSGQAFGAAPSDHSRATVACP